MVSSDHKDFECLCGIVGRAARIFAKSYICFLEKAIDAPLSDTFQSTVEQKENTFATQSKELSNEEKVEIIMTRTVSLIKLHWKIYKGLNVNNIPSIQETVVKDAFVDHFTTKYRAICERKYS